MNNHERVGHARRIMLAAWLLGVCGRASAAAIEVPLPTALDPKVESLLAPLSAMPSIQRADEVLRVEIEAGSAPDAKLVTAALTPSFGELRPRAELGLPTKVEADVPSRRWPGRSVDALEYALPPDLLPDLYDLEVSVAGFGLLSGRSGTDMQRRAVSIVAQYPKAPRVIVISDTHTGDPRDVIDVAQDALQRQEFMQVLEYIDRTVGNPMNAERWKAFAEVIREINLVRPDFVIVTGDLTFLVHDAVAPLEYDDAWRLLDRLEVPAYVAPGNHDLYVIDDMIAQGVDLLDGVKLWHDYFGPLYYSADVGPDLHLTARSSLEKSCAIPRTARCSSAPPRFPRNWSATSGASAATGAGASPRSRRPTTRAASIPPASAIPPPTNSSPPTPNALRTGPPSTRSTACSRIRPLNSRPPMAPPATSRSTAACSPTCRSP